MFRKTPQYTVCIDTISPLGHNLINKKRKYTDQQLRCWTKGTVSNGGQKWRQRIFFPRKKYCTTNTKGGYFLYAMLVFFSFSFLFFFYRISRDLCFLFCFFPPQPHPYNPPQTNMHFVVIWTNHTDLYNNLMNSETKAELVQSDTKYSVTLPSRPIFPTLNDSKCRFWHKCLRLA